MDLLGGLSHGLNGRDDLGRAFVVGLVVLAQTTGVFRGDAEGVVL
jgi:hypothetical protein